jgi:hypothetical protein
VGKADYQLTKLKFRERDASRSADPQRAVFIVASKPGNYGADPPQLGGRHGNGASGNSVLCFSLVTLMSHLDGIILRIYGDCA